MDGSGFPEEVRRELNKRFPGGWDLAPSRADADKLYAGGVGAVSLAGEIWPDYDRHLTEEEAHTCAGILREWFERRTEVARVPSVHRPDLKRDCWRLTVRRAIWPSEWPWEVSRDDSLKWPEGVWVEPPGGGGTLNLHRMAD